MSPSSHNPDRLQNDTINDNHDPPHEYSYSHLPSYEAVVGMPNFRQSPDNDQTEDHHSLSGQDDSENPATSIGDRTFGEVCDECFALEGVFVFAATSLILAVFIYCFVQWTNQNTAQCAIHRSSNSLHDTATVSSCDKDKARASMVSTCWDDMLLRCVRSAHSSGPGKLLRTSKQSWAKSGSNDDNHHDHRHGHRHNNHYLPDEDHKSPLYHHNYSTSKQRGVHLLVSQSSQGSDYSVSTLITIMAQAPATVSIIDEVKKMDDIRGIVKEGFSLSSASKVQSLVQSESLKMQELRSKAWLSQFSVLVAGKRINDMVSQLRGLQTTCSKRSRGRRSQMTLKEKRHILQCLTSLPPTNWTSSRSSTVAVLGLAYTYRQSRSLRSISHSDEPD